MKTNNIIFYKNDATRWCECHVCVSVYISLSLARLIRALCARICYFIIREEENAKQYIHLFWFHGSTHRCNWKPCLYILLVSLLLLPVFVMKKKLILAWTLWKHLLIYICIQTLDIGVALYCSLSPSRLGLCIYLPFYLTHLFSLLLFLIISLYFISLHRKQRNASIFL